MKFAWHSGCHFNSPTIHVYLCQYLYLRGAYLYLNLDLSMSVYIYTLNILSIYLSIYLSVYLPIYLSICPSTRLPTYPPTYLPINQSSYPIQSNLSTIPILSYPILSYLIYLIYLINLSNLIQFNLSYLICLCNRTYLFIYLYIYIFYIYIYTAPVFPKPPRTSVELPSVAFTATWRSAPWGTTYGIWSP